MGCSSCGAAANNNTVQRRFQINALPPNIVDNSDCPYTVEILNSWLQALTWFKSKALYKKQNIPASKVNAYLGILLTSLNVSSRCAYKASLDEMQDLIILITGLQND